MKAGEKLAKLKELGRGLEYDQTIGQQLVNRGKAVQRIENAKAARAQAKADAAENAQQVKAENKAGAVKEVSFNNLEVKLGGAMSSKIDYKALRAKIQKMQQNPQLQAPVKKGMAAG